MMDLAVDIRGATGDVQVLENVFEDLNTTLETVASTMERVVDALSPDESAFNGVLEGIDAFNVENIWNAVKTVFGMGVCFMESRQGRDCVKQIIWGGA